MNPPPREKIREFFSHYTKLSYEKGERILRENENPSGVLYLHKGTVRMYLISEEGNELTIMLMPEGSIFPLRWALDDITNIYNYQAMGPVEIWRAPRDGFLELIEKDAPTLMHITRQLVNDCSALAYRLQHLVFGNAYAKVAATVLTAAKQFGQSDDRSKAITVNLQLTHQQIADSAGVTRETASLEMKKLRQDGLINYKGRTLMVCDLEGLAQASFL